MADFDGHHVLRRAYWQVLEHLYLERGRTLYMADKMARQAAMCAWLGYEKWKVREMPESGLVDFSYRTVKRMRVLLGASAGRPVKLRPIPRQRPPQRRRRRRVR